MSHMSPKCPIWPIVGLLFVSINEGFEGFMEGYESQMAHMNHEGM
jgi:hypothetical protein